MTVVVMIVVLIIMKEKIKMRIYAKDLNKHLDQKIEFSGFVDSIRNLQWVQFVIVKDLTGKVQVTIEKSEEKNNLYHLKVQ